MNTLINFESTVLDLRQYSDNELYEICRRFGAVALKARNKFIGLLPEVNKRRLFEKKKFVSVFHFAAVLAGVSKEQVNRALSLAEKFENMPNLKRLLTGGIVSVNKLSRVASIATAENEGELADRVLQLSKSALETLVKDYILATRIANNGKTNDAKNEMNCLKNEDLNGLLEPQNGADFVPGHKPETTSDELSASQQKIEMSAIYETQLIHYIKTPQLSDKVKSELNDLQSKGINIDEIILEAIVRRKAEIAATKEQLAEKAEAKLIEQITEEKAVSTVVPAATKRLLKKEFGKKCAIEFCNNPSQEIHHTARFSISSSHNPYYLAPLCRQHHQIAHAVDVKVSENWVAKAK